MNGGDGLLLSLKLGFALVALVMIAAFVVIPMLKNLLQRPDVPDLSHFDMTPDELMDEELQIPEGGKKGMPDKHTLLQEARNDPRKTAMLITAWLREKK